MTSSGASMPFVASQSLTTCAPRSAFAGNACLCAASVSNNWRAITLLLNLLMSRMISGSDTDSHSVTSTAPGGVAPLRISP